MEKVIYKEISKQESNGQGFQDTQGDLYEYLLSEITSAGKLGQFRTPRHIIQLICELVDPHNCIRFTKTPEIVDYLIDILYI
jgi:type I restriction-modification system DNA methylase subunit